MITKRPAVSFELPVPAPSESEREGESGRLEREFERERERERARAGPCLQRGGRERERDVCVPIGSEAVPLWGDLIGSYI